MILEDYIHKHVHDPGEQVHDAQDVCGSGIDTGEVRGDDCSGIQADGLEAISRGILCALDSALRLAAKLRFRY